MNNDKYYDIWRRISQKEEKTELLSDRIIVCLNEDSNGEVYIGIEYINENGEKIGLDNLEKMENNKYFVKNYFNVVLPVFKNNTLISILYNLNTQNIELARIENSSMREKDIEYDRKNSVLLGYILNKNVNLNFEEKVKILYEVMKEIMRLAYCAEGEKIFIFKIKNNTIMNIYFGHRSYLNTDSLNEEINLAIIESQFNINLNESYQKVKK